MWARSTVTAKPVKGASELGNQIARLMAALTRAGQHNYPGSAPNSPRHRGCGRGKMDRATSSHPIPTMAKLVWDRLPQPAEYLLVTEQGPQIQVREGPRTQRWSGQSFKQKGPQFTPVFLISRLGSHGLGVCYPAKSLDQTRGNHGNVAQPPASSS